MIPTACGVDFGTSNSTVGWSRPDQHALLALEDGKTTLPSAIFFHDEDAEVSYGRAAISDYLAGYDGRLMRSMKSLLGSSLIDGFLMRDASSYEDIIDIIAGEGVLPADVSGPLRRLVALRRPLVQDYAGWARSELHDLTPELPTLLSRFSELVRSYLRSELGE